MSEAELLEALKAAHEDTIHLRAECQKLANLLMSSYTWVHEYKIAEVDEALAPYLGGYNDAPTESSTAS